MEWPIDVDAVRADDDLIEALAAGLVPPPTCRPGPGDVEAELVALLAGWVADVRPETLLHRPDDTPTRMPRVMLGSPPPGHEAADAPAQLLTEPVTARIPVTRLPGDGIVINGPWPARPGGGAADDADDDAVTTAIPVTGRRPSRPRSLYRAAVAAAFVLIAASGTVAGSYDAKPGGVLWPVTRVVFAEKARSVQAATNVTTGLARARQALRDGHTAEAKAAFQVVVAQLPAVSAEEGQDALMAQSSDLAGELGVAAPRGSAGSAVTAVADPPPLPTGRVLASGAVGASIDAADLPVPAGPRSPEPPRVDPAAAGSAPDGSLPAVSAPAGPLPAGSVPAPAGPGRPQRGADPLPPGAADPAGPATNGPATGGPTTGGPATGGPTTGGPTTGGTGTPSDPPGAADPPPVDPPAAGQLGERQPAGGHHPARQPAAGHPPAPGAHRPGPLRHPDRR